jgi:sigma-B regulation protein RsbU (phosphoserine phosphatase)
MDELDVAGVNVSAEAVGGDYYDWIELDEDTLVVVLGDVSGHGIPAAILMSHLQASLHAHARPGRRPREIVQDVHVALRRAVEVGRFATFFIAMFSRRDATLRYCNAGHNPPLLVRRGRIDRLTATGVPLAMLETAEWSDGEEAFGPGDLLVLYSDGIPECRDKREFYGEERLARRVAELDASGATAGAMVEALMADIHEFARGPLVEDDVTLVVVRRR